MIDLVSIQKYVEYRDMFQEKLLSRQKQPSLPGFVREDINLVNAVPVCLFYRFEGKPSCLSREALAGTG